MINISLEEEKMKNHFLRTTIMSLAICFVIFACFPYGIKINKAEAKSKIETQTSLVNPLELFDATTPGFLYYFSDAEHSQNYCSILKQNSIIADYHLEYRTNRESFSYFITNYYNAGLYNTIYDSYIIFELTLGFPERNNNNTLHFDPACLSVMFAKLKENGCKIMFVCGQFEDRFKPYNAFLDYVDIHINIGIFDVFIGNIFLDAYEDNSVQLNLTNCTFIIDRSLAENIQNGYLNCDFVNYWFLGYFREAYNTDIHLIGATWNLIFRNYNIKLYYHDSNGVFINAFPYPGEATIVNIDQQGESDAMLNEHIYAIGTTWINQQYTQEYLTALLDLRADFEYNFPIYVYDPNDYDISAYSDNNVYIAHGHLDYFDVIAEFLSDIDLSGYDNYPGRCVVSYLALPTGSGGWLTMPVTAIRWICPQGGSLDPDPI